MFTGIVFVALFILSIRVGIMEMSDSDDEAANTKHTRQDIRLVAFLLYGVLIMLGIIADRL